MRLKLYSTLLAALGALTGFQASASTAVLLDFEEFEESGTGSSLFPSPFETQGFRFTGNLSGSDYGIVRSGEGIFSGSTALIPFANDTHTLSAIDGRTFDLLSLDFTETSATSGSVSQIFSGNFFGGGSISQTITSDGIFGPESAVFSGFSDLVSVTFSTDDGALQLDNIALMPAAIPIPAGGALLISGLAGLAFVRRRRAA